MSASVPSQSLREAVAIVGDRWSPLLIASLLDGPRRFADLRDELADIAPNVLTTRLRQLEEEGVVVARPYSERPPRYTYELTDAGRSLAGPLRALAHWGASVRGGGEAPAHAACGTELEAGWYCPTCERPVADEEAEELHYA
jgi:DNA-binding HxlR family transcriptional regulator